ncbi:hypothetical protein B9Z55_022590 [Caenorhabditis nigoni]|uniref:Uncharacterized protein n=1 Tax=Caenorhabditis nigoni TaxID=1611254 RepID=A0A2G5SL18_9PELO|nr:hypothetical protein B9Z55_022590 [Caenorhabditis nigoni]
MDSDDDDVPLKDSTKEVKINGVSIPSMKDREVQIVGRFLKKEEAHLEVFNGKKWKKESPRNHPKSTWKRKNPYERIHQNNKADIAKAPRRDEFFEREAKYPKWIFSGPLTPDFYGPLNPPRQWPITVDLFDLEEALEKIKDLIPKVLWDRIQKDVGTVKGIGSKKAKGKKRVQYNKKDAGCALFNIAAFNDGRKFVEGIKDLKLPGIVPLGFGDNNDFLQGAYAGPPTASRLHLYAEDGDANTERTIDKSIYNIEEHAHRPTVSGSDCQSFLATMWPVSTFSDLRKVKKFECLEEEEYSFYMIAQYIFHAAVPTRHSPELSLTILRLVYYLAIRGVLGPFDDAEKRAKKVEYDLYNDRTDLSNSVSGLKTKAGQAIGWLGKFMTNSGFSPGLRCFRWFYRYVTDSTTVLINANKFLEWDQVIMRHIRFRNEEWKEEQEILFKLQNIGEPEESKFHDFYVPEDGDCMPRYSLPSSSEPSTSAAGQQSGSNKPREITFHGIRVGQLVPIPRPQPPQKPYERHTYDELNVQMEEHNYLVMAGLTKIKND